MKPTPRIYTPVHNSPKGIPIILCVFLCVSTSCKNMQHKKMLLCTCFSKLRSYSMIVFLVVNLRNKVCLTTNSAHLQREKNMPKAEAPARCKAEHPSSEEAGGGRCLSSPPGNAAFRFSTHRDNTVLTAKCSGYYTEGRQIMTFSQGIRESALWDKILLLRRAEGLQLYRNGDCKSRGWWKMFSCTLFTKIRKQLRAHHPY